MAEYRYDGRGKMIYAMAALWSERLPKRDGGLSRSILSLKEGMLRNTR
jgi:hypothetical protein